MDYLDSACENDTSLSRCPYTAQSDYMINNAATQLELSSLLRENIAEYISTIDDGKICAYKKPIHSIHKPPCPVRLFDTYQHQHSNNGSSVAVGS